MRGRLSLASLGGGSHDVGLWEVRCGLFTRLVFSACRRFSCFSCYFPSSFLLTIEHSRCEPRRPPLTQTYYSFYGFSSSEHLNLRGLFYQTALYVQVGVLPNLPDESVVTKARLEPGKMFLVDLEAGHIVPDDAVKEKYANRLPYGDWIEQNLINISGWTKHSKEVGTKVRKARLRV